MNRQTLTTPSLTSDNLAIDIERKPHCVVSLKVEVPSDFVKSQYEQAIKEVNKEVSLPGYRKGRAPRDYMISHFKPQIERQWKDEMAEETFQRVLRQTALYPLDRQTKIHCEWLSCDMEKGGRCLFEFEVLPEVPVVEYEQLEVSLPERACVCHEEVDCELQELAKRNAHWQDVTHDVAEEGEWVELEAIDQQGEPIYIGKRFEFTPSTMPKDLYDAVKGLKLNQISEAELKKPGADDIIHAKVTLVKILKRAYAPIDDNLAKHLGMADLPSLKERIEKNLRESTQNEFRTECFSAIQKALGEKYKFEVPQSSLGYEIRMHENALLSELEKSEEDLSEEEKRHFKATAHERAENAIRQTFLLHKIASQMHIQVEDSEVHELMRPFLHELEKERDQQKLRQRFQSLYGRCRMHLIAEKTLEQIAKSRDWL